MEVCFWCVSWEVIGLNIHDKGIEIDPKRIDNIKKL
jgi:hypothetical protein